MPQRPLSTRPPHLPARDVPLILCRLRRRRTPEDTARMPFFVVCTQPPQRGIAACEHTTRIPCRDSGATVGRRVRARWRCEPQGPSSAVVRTQVGLLRATPSRFATSGCAHCSPAGKTLPSPRPADTPPVAPAAGSSGALSLKRMYAAISQSTCARKESVPPRRHSYVVLTERVTVPDPSRSRKESSRARRGRAQSLAERGCCRGPGGST